MKASLKKLLFLSVFTFLISLTACGGSGGGGAGSPTPTPSPGATPPGSGTTPPSPAGPSSMVPPPDSDGLSAVPGLTQSTSPVVAVDGSGNAVVAWIENDAPGSGVSKVYCWRQNGTTWQHLGDGIRGGNGLIEPQSLNLVLKSDGNPVLAWVEEEAGSVNAANVYVRHWNGSSWQQYGTPFLSAVPNPTVGGTPLETHAAHVSLKLEPSGNPVVAWREIYDNPAMPGVYGSYGIFVYRWSGTAWGPMGTNPIEDVNIPGIYEGPTLAMQSTGNPVLVYVAPDPDPGAGIRVRYWDGASWPTYSSGNLNALGAPMDGLHKFEDPTVILDSDNKPWVGWWEQISGGATPSPRNLYTRHWTGSTWESFGANSGRVSSITASGDAWPYHTVPILDRSGNLVIAYGQSDGVHIRRWNPTATPPAWQDVASTPLAIRASAFATLSMATPSIAYDPAHNAVVIAWSELNATAQHIYVRRVSLD